MQNAASLQASVPKDDSFGAAFRLRRPQISPVPLIFASPHSGTLYPPRMRANLAVPLIDLRRTEDAFVDELFAGAPAEGAILIDARYSRMTVDLNRDPRELDRNMFYDGLPRKCGMPTARVEAGLGCLPRVAARGDAIYKELMSREEGEKRLSQLHDTYHQALRREIDGLVAGFGECVLIDCHSMPSRLPGRRPLADIVIGDRFGSSCDHRLSARAEQAFRRQGLTVARNSPYAGGYTTRAYGRPKRGVHALQIEINRSLYLDESQVVRSEGFTALQAVISVFIAEIAAFARELG